jgi:hypothetical protein
MKKFSIFLWIFLFSVSCLRSTHDSIDSLKAKISHAQTFDVGQQAKKIAESVTRKAHHHSSYRLNKKHQLILHGGMVIIKKCLKVVIKKVWLI